MELGKRKYPSTSEVETSLLKPKYLEKGRVERKPTDGFNKKARLIVRNLSFKTTEQTLRKHYEEYGEVKEVKILKRPNGDLVGCGFIQFNTPKEASQALLNTNAKEFLGRPIRVDWSVAKDVYARHLQKQKDENEVTEEVTIKSEPESDTEVEDKSQISTDLAIKDEIKSESEEESETESSETETESDSESESDSEPKPKISKIEEPVDNESKKQSANDAEDGKTVFMKNIPFEATQEQLKECMEQFGETVYALLNIDKITEHSKGTGFVRFKTLESAERCMASGTELTLLGQVLDPHPALSRNNAQGKGKKNESTTKDNRNLYLIKEGVILAGTPAAHGVSAADMAKRLQLELSKSQMLRNLNRFVSKFRLTVHNLPETYDDARLRALCTENGANVREARVMRENRPSPGYPMGKPKGFGFVSFASHEDAIATLRRLNNNPTVFSRQNRPIVAFSIEDKAAINAKQKRLQKSLTRNPTSKQYDPKQVEQDKNKQDGSKYAKGQNKKVFSKFNKKSLQDNPGKNFKKLDETKNTFSGVAAKPGKQKMRNKFNLKTQAKLHAETLKNDKNRLKKMKKSIGDRKKDHIRQPRQAQNSNVKNKSKNKNTSDDGNLSRLIGQYKNKLQQPTSGGNLKKSKWYE